MPKRSECNRVVFSVLSLVGVYVIGTSNLHADLVTRQAMNIAISEQHSAHMTLALAEFFGADSSTEQSIETSFQVSDAGWVFEMTDPDHAGAGELNYAASGTLGVDDIFTFSGAGTLGETPIAYIGGSGSVDLDAEMFTFDAQEFGVSGVKIGANSFWKSLAQALGMGNNSTSMWDFFTGDDDAPPSSDNATTIICIKGDGNNFDFSGAVFNGNVTINNNSTTNTITGIGSGNIESIPEPSFSSLYIALILFGGVMRRRRI